MRGPESGQFLPVDSATRLFLAHNSARGPAQPELVGSDAKTRKRNALLCGVVGVKWIVFCGNGNLSVADCCELLQRIVALEPFR